MSSKTKKSILQSINKNGFPEKVVSLPYKSIFNSCEANGLKLNDVLDSLMEQEIYSKIDGNKIFFASKDKSSTLVEAPEQLFAEEESVENESAPSTNKYDGSIMGIPRNVMEEAAKKMGLTPQKLKMVQEELKNMNPEKQDEFMKKVTGMYNSGGNETSPF